MITDFRRLYYSERTCFRYLFKIHESTTSFFAPISAMKSLNKAPTAAAAKALALCDCRLTPKKCILLAVRTLQAKFSNPMATGKGGLVSNHMFLGGCWYNRKTSSPCSHTDWDCSKGSNRNTVVLGNTGPYPPPFGKGFTVAPPMRKHTWMLSVSNTCCSASPIHSPHCQQLFVLAFSIQQWPACFRPQRLNVTRSLTTEQLFHLPH